MPRPFRRIGRSQTTGNPNADGTGGGVLDIFGNEYFQRIGGIFNAVPSYVLISESTTNVNEGSTVTFTITGTGIYSNTTLYWTTNQVSGTINASDFNDSSTTGSFSVTNGSGTVSRTLANDATTEGTESFQLQIRTGSTSGPVVVTSNTVTINDTSQTPSYITTASGGDLSAEATPDGNRYHVFYNPGSFTVPSPGYIDVLLVGGGASGLGGHGHGGAGGQVILQTQVLLSAGTYPVSIGAGAPPPGPGGAGQAGGNTTGFSYTGYGGGNDPALPSYIPSPFLPAKPGWGPGPEYGNLNGPVFGGSSNAGLGAGGEGANPNTTWRPGGNGRQVPAPFLPTNAPANLVAALGSTPTGAPAWRYFGGGGGGGGGNGFENSKGGNGGLGGGGGGGTGPGGAGGDPGYGYPFPPGGPLGDAGQDRRGGGGGGGGIGACGTTYCPAKAGGKGVLVVRYPS